MMNTVIQKISARQVLDCKARPMLEVDVFTQDGSMGRGAAPTGTSVGAHEAFVLRDYDVNEFNGLSVHKAVNTVETVIAPALLGMDAADQRAIDQRMLELDGTENKERLGGNSIYSVSIACLRAAAAAHKMPVYRYLRGGVLTNIPLPTFNVINGGRYPQLTQPFNEFMLAPWKARLGGGGRGTGGEGLSTPGTGDLAGIWEAKSPSWAGPTAGQLPAMIPMLSCN